MENWLKTHENGTVLKLYVAPGASKDQLSGLHGDRLKINELPLNSGVSSFIRNSLWKQIKRLRCA